MQCGHCKHEINISDRFCPYCGSPVTPPEGDGFTVAPKAKSSKKRRIILLSAVTAAVIAAAVLAWLFWPFGGNSETMVLTVDENYLVAGQPQEILFTASAEADVPAIVLCDSGGNNVGQLRDDGTAGDDTAGDGIYSYQMSVSPQSAGSESYYAQLGNDTSNSVSTYAFAPLTEEEANNARDTYKEVSAEISEIESSFLNGDGSVPSAQRETLIKEVEAVIEEYRQSGDILLYEVENDSVYIKFSSGLTMVYQPAETGVNGDGSDVDLTFWVYQPNPDVENSTLADYVKETADSLANCRYIENYTGTGVSLDIVKTLPNNSVVLWNGHGGYGPIVKSFLATGEDFDWAAWFLDLDYYADCVTDRIIGRGTDEQDNLACVTSKFIDYYCGDLSNSIFFLASCHSAQHDRLANSFLDKGAEAVLGFTDTVYTGYCQEFCCDCLIYMANVNESSGNYYTLSEAFEEVKEIVGTDDLVWASEYGFSKSQRAEPKIIGNGGYRLASLRTVDISILDDEDSSPISGGNVTAEDENKNQYEAVQVTGDGGEKIYRLQLPDGSYTVTASADGYIPEIQAIEISEDTSFDMRMKSGGTITVSVTDAESGEIISGAYTQYSDSENVEYSSEDGTAQLHLPFGKYKITVNADGYYSSEEMEVEISHNNSTEELNVALTPVRKLTGTYIGQYEANQGETGLTLTILSDNRCIFSFYNLPGHDNAEAGSYYADIRYENDHIIITGSKWVDKPLTYSFVEFTGTLSEDGARFTGSVNNSSWKFDLTSE